MRVTNFLLLFLVPSVLTAQITFQKTFGGAGSDGGYSVRQITSGGYIISGQTTSFGSGPVYIINVDAVGDILWTKTFGGTSGDWGLSIRQTTDSGYIITGYTGSFGAGGTDVYLIKTNSSGDTLWTKTYGGAGNEQGRSVQQTADSGYIIVGKTASFGAGSDDLYLIKTDSIGDTLWTKTYGGGSLDQGYSVMQTTDNGYIIGGYTISFGAGSYDMYLIKTDGNGDAQWIKTFGGASDDKGYSAQQTTDGGYIITGNTMSFGAGLYDAYLIKTDANGDMLWAKTYGGTNNDRAYSVQETASGGYIILGNTSSFGAGSSDVYLIKTDSNGDTLWTKTFGGIDYDQGNSYNIEQTNDGGYIIVGNTQSFGAGGQDIYLIKIDSLGNSGGCNEYPTATITNNTATQVGSGGIVSSGGVVDNTATITTNPATVDSVLCFSIQCNLMLNISVVNATTGNCDGEATVTASGGTPPYTYQWDTAANNQATQTADSLCAGSYCVTVTDANNCTFDTCVSLTVGINEQNQGEQTITIYPNPTSGEFTLEILKQVQNDILVFGLYDLMGRRVYRQQVTSNRQLIDVSGLARGLYLWQLGEARGKVVIE